MSGDGSTGAERRPSVGDMFRSLKPHQLTIDIVFAVLCVVLRSLFGFESPLYVVVVLLMASALAIRRLSPLLALGVLWFGVIVQLFGGANPDLSNAAVLPVLFATAAYGSSLTRWIGLASTGAGALVGTVYVVFHNLISPETVLGLNNAYGLSELPRYLTVGAIGFSATFAVFVLSWTIGLLVSSWRSSRLSREARHHAELEAAAAEREVAVEQERTRIARDMHDVVAHSLAVVIAQADGARYARKSDPESVDEALITISTTAREALGDVRLLLGQLRHDQAAGPQPVLADLDRLIDQMAASGLTVDRTRSGDELSLGTGQQLAVYRIVQEALTNALRHGDRSEDTILDFAWSPARLTVTITSPLAAGEPGTGHRPGHGLDGMRERALLAGGSFSARRDAGYFIVTVELPVQPATAPVQRMAPVSTAVAPATGPAVTTGTVS